MLVLRGCVHAVQGMFVNLDARLVEDVYHRCGYDTKAAMGKLMSVQACP